MEYRVLSPLPEVLSGVAACRDGQQHHHSVQQKIRRGEPVTRPTIPTLIAPRQELAGVGTRGGHCPPPPAPEPPRTQHRPKQSDRRGGCGDGIAVLGGLALEPSGTQSAADVIRCPARHHPQRRELRHTANSRSICPWPLVLRSEVLVLGRGRGTVEAGGVRRGETDMKGGWGPPLTWHLLRSAKQMPWGALGGWQVRQLPVSSRRFRASP